MLQSLVILKAVAFLASAALIFIALGLLLHCVGISLHSDAAEDSVAVRVPIVLAAVACAFTLRPSPDFRGVGSSMPTRQGPGRSDQSCPDG